MTEIRRLSNGDVDEIVAHSAFVHLERMDKDHIWMSVDDGEQLLHVNLISRGKIGIHVDVDRSPEVDGD